MKLHALDRMRVVSHSHDLSLHGLGGYLKTPRDRLPLDEKRVVAGGIERAGYPAEDASAVVMNGRRLPMHQARGANDPAAVCGPDALVPEADAEKGDAGAECPDHVATDPRLRWGARPGREDDPLRLQGPDLLDADAVVPMDDHLRAQLSEVLDEVVG